jgi:hypothetical protein
LKSVGARVLGAYEKYNEGQPAITSHDFGEGTALFIGAILEEEDVFTLMKRVASQAGVKFIDGIPEGLEVIPYESVLAVLNLTSERKEWEMDGDLAVFEPYDIQLWKTQQGG